MNFNNVYTTIGATITLAVCLVLGAIFGTPEKTGSSLVKQVAVSNEH